MNDLPQNISEIIKRHQEQHPVRVSAIAADLGIKILAAELPRGISGKLSRDPSDPNKWVIRVNRHEHKRRQRFTVAHELAHFILHKDQIRGELVDDTFYRSGLSERRETEANRLAAEILMPWPLIRQLTSQGVTTPSELASALDVSDAAMHIRLGLPT